VQHVRPGNLIAIGEGNKFYYFLVLSGSAFFGCQWAYCFYESSIDLLDSTDNLKTYGDGFPALVDFIEQRRENEIVKVGSSLDVSSYKVTSNLKARIDQYGGGHLWYIYSPGFSIIDKQAHLAPEQHGFPIASGLKAIDAIRLIQRRWKINEVVTEEGCGQYPV
jgi:hypothetical protein